MKMKISHICIIIAALLIAAHSVRYCDIRKKINILCKDNRVIASVYPNKLPMSDLNRKISDSFCYKKRDGIYFPWDEYSELMRRKRNPISLVFLLENTISKFLYH